VTFDGQKEGFSALKIHKEKQENNKQHQERET
jgi:hypothetical protein